jgi:hypothetical protein
MNYDDIRGSWWDDNGDDDDEVVANDNGREIFRPVMGRFIACCLDWGVQNTVFGFSDGDDDFWQCTECGYVHVSNRGVWEDDMRDR